MNPLQRASVRRKAYYFGAILALFTVSIFYRGLEARASDGHTYVWMPFGRDDGKGGTTPVNAGADWLARKSILSQARTAELRELEQGDPELTGSAVRLLLTGSRGLAVTALWQAAIEKQKRNDFHEFEVLVRQVTMLQPHFITPWIFQSWNIAYNVSVEMHSLGDMYFYIARGIELLSEGERRNRRSPDMRYQIAFYYQNKFGVADQVQTLRCLFQLSCIPKNEWKASGLTTADGSVDLPKFREFCEKHPMLVRRLRGEERRDRDKKGPNEGLRNRKPEDVVQFLRDNEKVPSRFKYGAEMAADDKQFPALPPRFNEGPDEAYPGKPLGDDFSGYLAARAWFTYANALVPPNTRDETGNPVPGPTPRPGEYDQFKFRVPRLPMLVIFRQGPPRAQSYQAEMMQKDGWFDAEGWEVDAGLDPGNQWFPGGLRVEVGGPTAAPNGVKYAVTVENTSAADLVGVVLRVPIPGGAAEVAAVDPKPDERRSERVVLAWPIGTPTPGKEPVLKPGEKKTVELVLRPPAGAARGAKLSPAASFEKAEVIVGAGPPWSQAAWQQAGDLWSKSGYECGLQLDDARLERLRLAAGLSKMAGDQVGIPRDLTPEQMADEDAARKYRATLALHFYQSNRAVTNFPYYLASAEAELKTETVQARKTLWRADQARRVGNKLEAIKLYEQGLKEWKQVLLRNPNFHRPERFDRVEEETFEYELEYIRLIAQDYQPVRDRARKEFADEYAKKATAVAPFSTAVPGPTTIPEAIREDLYMMVAEKMSPFFEPIPDNVGDARAGTPWVRNEIKETVLGRQGVKRKPAGAPAGAPVGPSAPPGPPPPGGPPR
ncbi:MAG: hypothetical protein JWO38_3313 [Gemmataceae bacterium]|nr:hypothetical protein [Gemmataceae bacterium]